MSDEIRERIRKQGWNVVYVPAQSDVPEYSYTVGLARRGLHEFIVFGFSPGLARPVLDDLAQRALDGERFPINAVLQDLLPGMPAVLIDVPDVEAQHYLANAKEFAPKTLRAFQIAWPDGQDLFPWQEGYDEVFRTRQVVLNPFAKTARRQPRHDVRAMLRPGPSPSVLEQIGMQVDREQHRRIGVDLPDLPIEEAIPTRRTLRRLGRWRHAIHRRLAGARLVRCRREQAHRRRPALGQALCMEPLRLYRFRYRDARTGRWVKTRYRAEAIVIRMTHS